VLAVTVPLYADHNIRDDIVIGVRAYGIDVLMAREDKSERLPDESLLDRATELGRVLCTEDSDFYRITARWWQVGHQFAGVAHIDQDAAPISRLIEDLVLIATAHTVDDLRNRLVYVPIR
jgi:hypothetical protein